MILIKEGALERIKNWEDSSIHVLTDFDGTITSGFNNSWNILSKSNLVPKEYVEESQKLYNYYSPLELDESIEYKDKVKYMQEWWDKHIGLLIKYKMSERIVNEACQNPKIMAFREGAQEFFKMMYDRNIPVIIISAGIGNFIEEFLKNNNCYYKNIHIISNFLKFENGIAVGISSTIIHSLNKNEIAIPNEIKKLIKDKPNIILLGDIIADIKMIPEEYQDNALKIGFLDVKIEENQKYYEKQFDIVGTNNTTFNELIKILKEKSEM